MSSATSTGGRLDTWSVPVAALVALVVVTGGRSWHLSRHLVTLVHEGGHAAAAVLTGRRLRGIRLHSDTSGLTVSSGPPGGPGMVVTLLAGYLAPSLLGLAGAGMLARGWVSGLLWSLVPALVAVLVMIRNVFGVVSVLTVGAAVGAVAWYGDARVQAGFAAVLVWFLLLGGVRPVLELRRQRRRGRAPGSDADQLSRLTPLPASAWVAVFGLATLACLLAGGWLLLADLLSGLQG